MLVADMRIKITPGHGRVTGVFCEKCGVAVYSRARHDFRYCKCGNVAVDGGPHFLGSSDSNYMQVSYKDPSTAFMAKISIGGLTKKDLAIDWAEKKDDLGWETDRTKIEVGKSVADETED